ncbi:MAG: hypothetical protein L0K86_11575 [Actinomycetia bacterium]|nr:hypothetical protein [Actinomycetes bacterium]
MPNTAGRRGRPRLPRVRPAVPMRELGRAMEQIRTWAGYREGAVTRLNESIRHLYPDAPPGGRRSGPVSEPRLLTNSRLITDVEAGRDTDADGKHWLHNLVPRPGRRVNAPPLWLVRAYDHAFHADGYLLDLHRWSVSAQRDQQRLRSGALIDVPPKRLRERMLAGFETAPAEIRALLLRHAEELADRRTAPGQSRYTGVQLVDDGSAGMPEGTVLPPGGVVTVTWTFRNVGPAPWDDCMLVRTDPEPAGLAAPPFVPVAATEADAAAVVTCPVRAGDRPGTHRVSYKMARSDGTWCTPGSFLGVFATIVVPPRELAPIWHVWPTVVE